MVNELHIYIYMCALHMLFLLVNYNFWKKKKMIDHLIMKLSYEDD